jgi:hypothetical protein
MVRFVAMKRPPGRVPTWMDVVVASAATVATLVPYATLLVIRPQYEYLFLASLLAIAGAMVGVTAVVPHRRPSEGWAQLRGLAVGILAFGSVDGAAFGGIFLWPAALFALASLFTAVWRQRSRA